MSMRALGTSGKPRHERTAGQSRDIAQGPSSAIQGDKQARSAAESNIDLSDSDDSDSTLSSGGSTKTPLERRKKQTVDNVMSVVMRWLDSTYPLTQNRPGGDPSIHSRGASDGNGGGRSKTGKRSGDDNDDDDNKENGAPRRPRKRQQRDESREGSGDGDDGRDGGKPNKPARKSNEESQRKFACPFYKHDPSKHRTSRACRFPGFDTLHRLKEHIYRKHMSGNGCPRCAEKFASDKALDAHLRADERCEKKDVVSDDGIDKAQEKRLRARPRKKDSSTDEEKWVAIYKIIYPDTPEDSIPSPYCDEPPSQSLDGMNAYVRRGLPNIVRRRLEVEIERFHADVEKEMIAKALEFLPQITDVLIKSYRGQKDQPDDNTLASLSSDIITGNALQPLQVEHSPSTLDQSVLDDIDFFNDHGIEFLSEDFISGYSEDVANLGPDFSYYGQAVGNQ